MKMFMRPNYRAAIAHQVLKRVLFHMVNANDHLDAQRIPAGLWLQFNPPNWLIVVGSSMDYIDNFRY